MGEVIRVRRHVPRRAARTAPAAACRHQRFLEFAPDGYLATDRQGVIQEANRFAAAIFRVPPADLVGEPLDGLVSARERTRFRARLSGLDCREPLCAEEWEVRIRPAGARERDVALTVASLEEPRGSGRLLWAVRDITRRKKTERELQESERRYRALYRQTLDHRNQLRVLSARLLHAREEQAKLIAHQLHDEAGQITASAHLTLAELARDLPEESGSRLREVELLLNDIEARLRRLSHELRPTILDDLGLGPALEFLAEGFSARTQIPITVENSMGKRVDALLETAVYRIVQEALANVSRHARAAHAWICLRRRQGALVCSVKDDGIGFDVRRLGQPRRRPRGLGLLGVRERLDALGGSVRIVSAPGAGTELTVTVPLRRRP